eukprot:TRINITY_DN22947_c0_g1_i1.p1 TRINITY_DN22947_c0_g1~~TRINITY_DN22947_c0_g1_i1.p1  ORF type:complete len:116 (+),score=19.90 TRINITY_DN22947_c0_g1_i1:49-348(+)
MCIRDRYMGNSRNRWVNTKIQKISTTKNNNSRLGSNSFWGSISFGWVNYLFDVNKSPKPFSQQDYPSLFESDKTVSTFNRFEKTWKENQKHKYLSLIHI